VLGGPGPSALVPVTPPRADTGFETAITLSKSYATVAIQALNAAGKVLATSQPVAPT
jgi:hypothetical protein